MLAIPFQCESLLSQFDGRVTLAPAAGDYPQSIINDQIVDDSDVVVGVFWSRLGTPTPEAASGTVEEIDRLRARGKKVLLYFSKANLPQDYDQAQFTQLQKYKKNLQNDTLYWEFETRAQLEKIFVPHLAKVVHEIAASINIEAQHGPLPVSNLISLKPLQGPRRVMLDDHEIWSEVTGEHEDSLFAAIAIFRDEPIKGMQLAEIQDLTAQITFYEGDGGEVQRVYNGTWLGESFNLTSLSIGETRELLLSVDDPDAKTPFAIENTRSRAFYDHLRK